MRLVVPLLFGLMCFAGEILSGTGVLDRMRVEDREARNEYQRRRLFAGDTSVSTRAAVAASRDFAWQLPTVESAALYGKGGASTLSSLSQRGPLRTGGRTRALAFDRTNPSTMFAGGADGGLFRSDNGGASWYRLTTIDGTQGVTSIVQDPRPGYEHLWYYGTGELRGSALRLVDGWRSQGDGIYASADGGFTWRLLPATATDDPARLLRAFQGVWNIAVHPSNGAIYAAGLGGVLYSADGGTSWEVILGVDGIEGSFYSDVHIAPDGAVWASLSNRTRFGRPVPHQSGIFHAADGRNFSRVALVDDSIRVNRSVFASSRLAPSTVYILSETPGTGVNNHRLWSVSHRGDDSYTVTDRSLAIPRDTTRDDPFSFNFSSQGSYDLVVAVSDADTAEVVIGGISLYRSDDGFLSALSVRRIGGYIDIPDEDDPTLESITWYGHHPDQHAFLFDPRNVRAAWSACDAGVFFTSDYRADTVRWQSKNAGYITTQFYTVAIDPVTPGSEIIAAGAQDNGTWAASDRGEYMRNIQGGDGAVSAIVPGGKTIYSSSQFAGIIRHRINSRGEVSGWSIVAPAREEWYLFVAPMELDIADTAAMFLAGGWNLLRHPNLGNIPEGFDTLAFGWEPVASVGSLSKGRISALAQSANASSVWLGTEQGAVVFVPRDGDTFGAPVDRSSPLFPANAYVGALSVDPDDDRHVMVAFTNFGILSLFASTDAGESWQEVAGNLEEFRDGTGRGPGVKHCAIVRYGGSVRYLAGTTAGLYTTDVLRGGSTVWVRMAESALGRSNIEMVSVRRSDGTIVVATHGNGLFEGKLSASAAPETSPSAAVVGVSPNPALSSAYLRFSLAKQARVEVSVYDIRGLRVAAVDGGSPQPGEQMVSLPVREMAPGRYEVVLTVDGAKAGSVPLYVAGR